MRISEINNEQTFSWFYMSLKSLIFIVLGILLFISMYRRFFVHNSVAIANTMQLEYAINSYLEKGIFVNNFKSKYFENVSDTTSKMRYLAKHYDYPGDLNRGLTVKYLDMCITLLRKKYKLNIKGYHFNKEIDPDYINIYFISSDPKGYFQEFKNNCAYTGHKNIIICDANYIKKFQFISYIEGRLDSLNLGNPTLKILDYKHKNPIAVPWLLKNLACCSHNMLWIIGHEIGHIANKHNNYHFTYDKDEFLRRSIFKENQADSFALEVVTEMERKNPNTWIAGGLFVGLDNTVQEIHWNFCPDRSDHSYTNCKKKLFIPNDSKTHPPLILRAIKFQRPLGRFIYYEENDANLDSLLKRIKIIN